MGSSRPEQLAWKAFAKAAVGSGLLMFRVENLVSCGMSDVVGKNQNDAMFWMELKDVEVIPVRESTSLLNGKFEPGQVPFLSGWTTHGKGTAHAYVLVRLPRKEWLLLDPRKADVKKGSLNELRKFSCCHGSCESVIEYLKGLE